MYLYNNNFSFNKISFYVSGTSTKKFEEIFFSFASILLANRLKWVSEDSQKIKKKLK